MGNYCTSFVICLAQTQRQPLGCVYCATLGVQLSFQQSLQSSAFLLVFNRLCKVFPRISFKNEYSFFSDVFVCD
jgi:hypothetical protein